MFEPLPESADEHIERLLRSVLVASPGVPAADVLADIDPNQLGQRGQLLLLEAWVSMDVAATLRLAPSTADRRLAVARRLSGPPPIGGY
ncbi:MAG: hypothetical protein ACR2J0_03485, partial [Mycobacteriales bacterium]